MDWKSVCKSELEGGLGFRPVTLMNQALLGKWLWRLGNETEGLRRQLVLAKYGRIREGWEIKKRNYKELAIWKGFTSNNASFMKFIRYRVTSKEKIQFGLDVWEGNTPLADRYPDLFRCALDKGVKIQNYIERQGPGAQVIWGLTIRINLMENEENQLTSLLNLLNGIFIPEKGEDVRLWSASENGTFSVSSFFSEISRRETTRNSIASVWRLKAPPRVVIFGWLAIQKKILTMDKLRRRGKILVNAWAVCLEKEETVDHLALN